MVSQEKLVSSIDLMDIYRLNVAYSGYKHNKSFSCFNIVSSCVYQ